jgi:drug/metabolite transporter (DMT)-like permease
MTFPLPVGTLLILVSTVLWGSTFVVIKGALGQADPLELVFFRSAIAVLVAAPFLRWTDSKALRAGLELGVWMGMGHILQTVGLMHTTTNKSAFLTALYVLFVPIMNALWGKKVSVAVWCCAGLALLGTGLLAYEHTPPNRGDALTILSAIMYAMYMVRMETLCHAGRSIDLAGFQALGAALCTLAFGLRVAPSLTSVPWGASLYLGVVIGLGCVLLQTEGQKHVPAAKAAVLFAAEPVWASMFAYAFQGERLGERGLLGAFLIVFAVALVGVLSSKKSPPAACGDRSAPIVL